MMAIASVLLALCVECAAGTPIDASPAAADTFSRVVEADWLRQITVRELAATNAEIRPEDDAAGGCDGVKDGRWGFHTLRESTPWWQVDFEEELQIERLLVFNRCDASPERARRLEVLLSSDQRSWVRAYQHGGATFRGVPDGKPLEVPLQGARARFVRLQLGEAGFLHLDEVEVYASGNARDNVARGKPATQSSVSQWSKRKPQAVEGGDFPDDAALGRRLVAKAMARGEALLAKLRSLGADVEPEARELAESRLALAALPDGAGGMRESYLAVRRAVRRLAFKNPLLDFDRVLFVKRVPTSFTHMSDQFYGWFSRPGGGLCVLEGLRSGAPEVRRLAEVLPEGNIVEPELSYDGTKVLFAHARFHPDLAGEANKLDKSRIPEDAFYHLYEVNLDGSELRRLTRGKHDDFSGRYLPTGEIVFLSTRRGNSVQCVTSAALEPSPAAPPDSYVRCGGGPERPVAVYTLHVMGPNGESIRTISPFENFEWYPQVASDGRILYARWDYIDRDNMPYMSLWSCLPDGTSAQAVFGNYTVSPYSVFEAQSIPRSRKLVFTASAHHGITGGSLVLLDPAQGTDGPAPMTRLTPEVPFPEIEGLPRTYFANPHPLSEEHFLVAWSDQPMVDGWPQINPPNALGIYLFDVFGNLELLHRDPAISSQNPIPVRPRSRPSPLPSIGKAKQEKSASCDEGRMLVLNVREGLDGAAADAVRRLRIVGVPAKTHPTMNFPPLGITRDDPGKFVLGTVPIEADGSAFFRVPAGVPVFLQALDSEGRAIQTMRSVTYVQPGQTHSCIGCHEPRNTSPGNRSPLAAQREPSRIAPGPEGSWPLDFDALVGPVIAKRCAGCHQAGAEGAKVDLTPSRAYETLVAYGERNLKHEVMVGYRRGHSIAGRELSHGSSLVELLERGHAMVRLDADDRERLFTWIDTYSQLRGSFGPEQEDELRTLRGRWAPLLEKEQP